MARMRKKGKKHAAAISCGRVIARGVFSGLRFRDLRSLYHAVHHGAAAVYVSTCVLLAEVVFRPAHVGAGSRVCLEGYVRERRDAGSLRRSDEEWKHAVHRLTAGRIILRIVKQSTSPVGMVYRRIYSHSLPHEQLLSTVASAA